MIRVSCNQGLLPAELIERYSSKCTSILNDLKQRYAAADTSPYIFLHIPNQAEHYAEIQHIAQRIVHQQPVDIILVVGIGGSALGTQAIYHALHHTLPHQSPELWCADTVDPVTTHTLLRNISIALEHNKRIILIIISKSGTTLETCANAALYLQTLEKHVHNIKDHVVVITNKHSTLATWAEQEHFMCITIPPSLGGRFSVFSAVGMLPLHLLGVAIPELLEGAHAATDTLACDIGDIVMQISMLAGAYEYGMVIHDTFVNAPHLLSYGAWYRQLMAESLGKDRKGMTPTVSCIAHDLHSMVQLYLAGPQRTITTFLDLCDYSAQPAVVPNNTLARLVENLPHASTQHIHNALCWGIQRAYREAQLPYLCIKSNACTAITLGFLMQQQMIIITALGILWGINPFDQPQVEDYKKWTRQNLKN